jgi:hypothetical protein
MPSPLSEIIFNLISRVEQWRKSDMLLRNRRMGDAPADWFNAPMLIRISVFAGLVLGASDSSAQSSAPPVTGVNLAVAATPSSSFDLLRDAPLAFRIPPSRQPAFKT